MNNTVLNLKLKPSDLKRYRLDRDWTLQQMAGFLKISVATAWKYENGGTKMHERIAARILRLIPELRRSA